MIFRNKGSSIKKTNTLSKDELIKYYGLNSFEFTHKDKKEIFVCSKYKEFDLIELDQLLQTVGWSRRPIRRVKKALEQSALWDEVKNDLDKSALALSGGQQQRLCIARTLAVEPKILLMDEPTSALDPIATAKVEELIHQLKENYTIIIVTHNMQQASRISDFTAFFYMGDLIEYDKTDTIFTKPKNERTQNYITGRFG